MILRPIVRWLLHSRPRFYAVVIGAIVFGVVLARVAGSGSPEPDSAPVAAPPSSTSSTTAAPSTTSSSPTPSTTATTAPAPSLPPRELAERVAQLWSDHSVPGSQWLARLRPLATDEYGGVTLAQVDPENVPANRVTGPARMVSDGSGTATADVPLDTMTLRVEMVDTGGGAWRVSSLAPPDGA